MSVERDSALLRDKQIISVSELAGGFSSASTIGVIWIRERNGEIHRTYGGVPSGFVC